jgi:hypothetical protein
LAKNENDALILQKFMEKSGDVEIFKKLDALGREVETDVRDQKNN